MINPMEKKLFELKITDLNQQGQGVGRLDGQVVFVDGAIPGDYIAAQLVEDHRQYAVARLARIITPSPDRQTPFCAIAERCGGCALQAMRYEAQLVLKRRHVVELLARIGQLPDADNLVEATLGMANPYHYRCKVQFPVRGTVKAPEIGFYERRSHAVVDNDVCGIGHPVSDIVRACVRDYITRFAVEPYDESTHRGSLRHLVVRVARQTGQVMVILVNRSTTLPGTRWLAEKLRSAIAAFRVTPDEPAGAFALTSLVLNVQPARTNVILGAKTILLDGQEWIEEQLLGLKFQISPLSFFQVNPEQTAVLYDQAVAMAALSAQDQALDLYCGTGTIALALARQAGSVIGVEAVAPAIQDAWGNAERNGLSNIHFEVARAEEWLPKAVAEGSIHPTVAVIDPPRRGCDETLLEALKAVPLERLVYVSCNPATLARDVARLAPVYHVRKVQPVDMFPWTDSIECVCLLTRVNSDPPTGQI
ncbi:MAG: rRNA (uracil-5-)-methyltransferase RumA [Firmicutes bacterium]|nr:rRNA (uracil-5-)-methyltransferase RumA [Bacillota bacterium]